MKWYLLFALLFVIVVVAEDSSSSEEDEPGLPSAETCDPERCQLPDCRCSTTDIPGNLRPRDTPQFVLLTFDDAINAINIKTYRRLLDNRRNSDQCTAAATFFVSHEYSNYQLVNELYNKGHEIALHSITHQTPQTYWQESTTETMRREFADQKTQISHFANIPPSSVHGLRIPFLQMTGNASFEMMKEVGLNYDCTWPTVSHINPGLWPYSLDFASTQDCVIPPCPTASFPNTWVLPMISWRDLNGVQCSMVDSCFNVPPLNDEDAWFDFILGNFERHYFGNRAPFGFYIHEWYLAVNPAVERALVRFMDLLKNLHDAFLVNGNEVIEWVKNPVPVNEYRKQPCRGFQPSVCPATSCGPLRGAHNDMDYWMQICNSCPATYPWLHNPLGQ